MTRDRKHANYAEGRAGTSGFTLIELVVSMAVLGIAMLIIISFFVSQNKVDTMNQANFLQQQQGMYLLSSLTREIRKAGYLHTSSGSDQDVDIAEQKRIRFYVDADSKITYYYNSTTNSMTQITDDFPSGRTIFNELNITTLSFSYYNGDDEELSTPVSSSNLGDIRKIDIYFEVQPDLDLNGGGEPDTFPFNNSVRPRNLGMFEE